MRSVLDGDAVFVPYDVPRRGVHEGSDPRGELEVAAATDLSGVRGGCWAWQVLG